jgi:hypothetical protein
VVNSELYLFREDDFAGLELQSSMEVYTDIFLEDRDDDFYQVAGWTGPRLARLGSWTLRSAFGGRVSFYDYERYGAIGDAYLTLENSEEGLLRYVELHGSYEDYGAGEFADSDGPAVSLFAELRVEAPPWGDSLWLLPGVNHYHAEQRRLRYTELGAVLGWGTHLVGPLRLDLDVYGSYSLFADSESNVSGDRRDWYTLANASFGLYPFFSGLQTLEVRYSYERTDSTDRFQRFDGHSAGLFFTRSF